MQKLQRIFYWEKKVPVEEALCAVRIVIKPWGTGIVRMEQALFGVVTTILVLYSLLVLSWILWSV
jgi:hypothetical protein